MSEPIIDKEGRKWVLGKTKFRIREHKFKNAIRDGYIKSFSDVFLFEKTLHGFPLPEWANGRTGYVYWDTCEIVKEDNKILKFMELP